jgi:hypothetical protein
MSTNELNLNNKFGQCCNCPALMSDKGRMFTNYVSSRIYNDYASKMFFISDAHTYREKLQVDGSAIRADEIQKYEKNKCKNNKKNSFYIDSSKYTFDKPLTDAYWGQKIQNDGKVKKSGKASF